jgi:hypothetical protein
MCIGEKVPHTSASDHAECGKARALFLMSSLASIATHWESTTLSRNPNSFFARICESRIPKT